MVTVEDKNGVLTLSLSAGALAILDRWRRSDGRSVPELLTAVLTDGLSTQSRLYRQLDADVYKTASSVLSLEKQQQLESLLDEGRQIVASQRP